jgi:hypothetical protein
MSFCGKLKRKKESEIVKHQKLRYSEMLLKAKFLLISSILISNINQSAHFSKEKRGFEKTAQYILSNTTTDMYLYIFFLNPV